MDILFLLRTLAGSRQVILILGIALLLKLGYIEFFKFTVSGFDQTFTVDENVVLVILLAFAGLLMLSKLTTRLRQVSIVSSIENILSGEVTANFAFDLKGLYQRKSHVILPDRWVNVILPTSDNDSSFQDMCLGN
jgi:hypothetical protein